MLYCLIVLVIIALSAGSWYSAQAAPGDEVISAGQLLFEGSRPGVYQPSLIHSSEVHFQISGMIAQVTLKQTFRNDSDKWLEGVYVFPLPEKAAVNRLRVVVGERIIEGRIYEKQAARKLYSAAKKAGRKAALVEQQRANIFRSKIANIPPGETIEVELQYLQTVSYQQGQFSLRFPMTITPRYFPGVALLKDVAKRQGEDSLLHQEVSFERGLGWAFNTDQVPDASLLSPYLNPHLATAAKPINPIVISAEIDMGMPLRKIESAYHNIVLSRNNNRYKLRLAAPQVSMEQDFVLNWQPVVGSEPTAALFSERLGEDDYTSLMVLPPTISRGDKRMAKEVIYIIDSSGSMDGVSIRQARKGLLLGLEQLHSDDRFNIIEFNSKTLPLFNTAVEASSKNLSQARNYVGNIRSGGGTEMLGALRFALRANAITEHSPKEYVRQIIFITDGAVANEEALFGEIQQHLGQSRLFTVGIGSAPNSFFMRKAAQFGRGTFTYIGDINQVEQKMTALFEQLKQPVMRNISLQWPRKSTTESYPKRIPDLYQGEPLIVSTRSRELSGSVVISGDIAGKTWRQEIPINYGESKPGIATLWAREKIDSLLDEKIAGRDKKEIRRAVLVVALSHQLVSPYTSFLALEKNISRPVNAPLSTAAVANTRPKGQGAQVYAYPNTASRGRQSLVLALFFLLLAWICVRCIRKEEQYDLIV